MSSETGSGDRRGAGPEQATGPAAERRLLRRATSPDPDGRFISVDPRSAPWRYLSVDAYRLRPGQRVERAADSMERLILILEGHASVSAGERSFGVLGSRNSVFAGPPAAQVLVEPGLPASVVAESDVLLVVGAAEGGQVHRTDVIDPRDVFVESRGSGDTARRIHHLLPPAAEAGRLIAFEVYTPAGNWSSYPPHKHDTEDPPREAYLEELYFYRFARPTGFAFQRVYTADRSLDETVTAGDGDAVLVPAGYHVVGAAAGYETYYLNLMAGPHRAWHFTVDPDHAWLMDWDPATPRGR